ncbi:glycosyltransferase family 2 protein [Chondrinema litorale]|uniref:glycosyltransferase family 2 protein n=1 Tax=Chondrinema litorale TaxID=2994555 RepID=UPI002543996F|nr:glycosyltransferase family 2 protein [Chondrinema litorale]UZR93092.1 glycosyltransferase family 2 protein [Chondrinema litorale]
MESRSKVAVVILNYNTRDLLEQFLPLVKTYSGDAQIIVADNASPDDSVSYLEQNHPDVKIIKLSQNLGFCGGYNESLKQVDADYLVLLNTDIEVTPGWLDPLVAVLDSNLQIACCQPKIKSYNNKNVFEHAGAAGGFIDYLGYPFCRGRIFNTVEEDHGQYNDSSQIFWASGACMCIRTELFKSFGGFDESFFAHMEEIDLCWRMQRAGYKVFYTPQSEVYHIGGGTLDYENPRKVYLNFRNGLFMIYKNLPSQNLLPLIFMRLVLDGVAACSFLVQGKFKSILAVLNAHFSFYTNLKSLNLKRNELQPSHKFKVNLPIYNKSIVFSYFVKKQQTFNSLEKINY